MSWLFKIEGNAVFPNPETLLIPPFKDIWDRDKNKDKWNAIKELAYAEFMTSQLKTNPYKGYEEETKKELILNDIIKDKDWKPDELVLAAIDKIIDIQTRGSFSYRSYLTAINVKQKSEDMINSFDPNERTSTGGLVLKPKDIGDALVNYGKITIEMENLKKKVEEELFETVKTTANKEISPFAYPESI